MFAGRPRYLLEVLSECGGPIQSSFGMRAETNALSEWRFDTLIFGGPLDPVPGSAACGRLGTPINEALSAGRGAVDRRLYAGRGGDTQRKICDDALAVGRRVAVSLPTSHGSE